MIEIFADDATIGENKFVLNQHRRNLSKRIMLDNVLVPPKRAAGLHRLSDVEHLDLADQPELVGADFDLASEGRGRGLIQFHEIPSFFA